MEISRVPGIDCVIRAECAAGRLGLGLGNCWVTSRPGESRCCRVVIQMLVILPGEHRACARPAKGWGIAQQQSEAPTAEKGECLACPTSLAFSINLFLTRFQLCFGLQFAFPLRGAVPLVKEGLRFCCCSVEECSCHL